MKCRDARTAALAAIAGLFAIAAQAEAYSLKSPDGRNEIRVETGAALKFSVLRDGEVRVSPTPIAMKFQGRTIGPAAQVVSAARRRVGGKVPMPVWKKAELDETREELVIEAEGGWSLRLAARDDAVAYRFETSFGGRTKVIDEEAGFSLPDGSCRCTYNRTNAKPFGGDPFQVSWETIAERTNALAVAAKTGERHIYAPMLVEYPGGGAMAVCETALLDYTKRDFSKKPGETFFKSEFAHCPDPSRTGNDRRHMRVLGRLDWIAETDGTRVYPWRLFLLEDSAVGLCASEAVAALAERSRVGDVSWIKPGKVAWEWWNCWNISGVRFKAGSTRLRAVNMETYRHYIDFASEYGVEYVIMDEGWSRNLDVMDVIPGMDIPELVKYAAEKGVGIILWCSWPQLVDRPREVFGHYAKMGVKGFKIDFMDRGDQFVVKFQEDIAALAAEYRLIVDFHGAFPPAGLSRTYPNVVNYEGVFGLEQTKWCDPKTDFPAADLGTFFVRMTAGPLDYTPGAMINSTRYAGKPAPHGFRSDYVKPGSMGTRVHQMALMSLYEAPLQMLCDSPTRYRRNAECFRFMAGVPTVWDDTVGLSGDTERYALAARRRGDTWYVSGIASWSGAEVSANLSFLGSGEWQAEIFEDGINCELDAEDYVHRFDIVKAGDRFPIVMGPGGGFTMKLVPAEKLPLRACFSPTEGETIIVAGLADAKADFAFFNRRLRIDARADGPGRAILTFAADPAVGAYVRFFVPVGCRPVVKLNGVVHDGVMPGRNNLIWRKWTYGDRLELDFSAKAAQAAEPALDRAAWMRGRYGLMVHWLYPSYGDVDRWTDAFDVESFLGDFSRTGAEWLIFTAGQCRGVYCSPNKRFAELCGPGHSSKRDLLSEIARGVKRLGKRFVVYAACDSVKDGCCDHSVQKGLCWDNSSEDRREYQMRWASVLREWSLRLGEDCDGWWLDGLGTQYPHGVDFSLWERACRAGNPKSAVAFNQGGNMFAPYGPSDYAAGKTTSLKWATLDLDAPPPIDAVRHYLFPVDGYWGAFWAWPSGEWSGVGHLRETRPELFSQKALDARLEAGDPVKSIYGASELRSFMEKLVKAGGAATINVGIMPNGRLNPHSVELIRSAMISDVKQRDKGGML